MAAADERERLLRVLSAATFVVFFQAYMVAPILPRLGATFGVPTRTVGFVVPAYLIPYGAATIFYGLLADRVGLRPIMFASLLTFTLLTALTATAQSVSQLITWRVLTGLGASGIVPLALVLVGYLFPYEQRGRPLGWLFGAMAGGMAFGSTVGAVLEPFIGWRGIFLSVSAAGAVLLLLILPHHRRIAATHVVGGRLRDLFAAYRELLGTMRAQRTYGYVFANAIFHSGVFTWLGTYFAERYHLGEVGIGLALLGYGIPGFVFGPLIGRAADRWGRGRLLPLGVALAAAAAGILSLDVPLLVAAVAVTALSFGYDLTQPLLAGIVTALGGKRGGQAMGLNVFTLFTGFGIGSLLFQEILPLGFSISLTVFAVVQLLLGLLAFPLFRSEAAVRDSTRRSVDTI